MGMSTRSKSSAGSKSAAQTASTPLISKSRKPKGKKGGTIAVQPTTVSVGDVVPTVSLYTDAGSAVSSAALAGDKAGAVLFLYPRANTPGCTTQACAFRDRLEDVAARGLAVWGLSYDKPKSQAAWKTKHELPYGLLCDALDVGFVKMLGAHKAPKSVKRSVFVLMKNDKGELVVRMAKVGVSPKDSVPAVLEFMQTEKKDAEVTEG